MNYTELLYEVVIPAIKNRDNDRSKEIGEGSQGIIVDNFRCRDHVGVCFKVNYPTDSAINEYQVQEYLYNLGLDVPKPIKLFPEANSFVMEKVIGWNLEEICGMKLKISRDVFDAMKESLESVCSKVSHGDLSPRNVMFGDVTIEDEVIVDAATYVIDFGHSVIRDSVKSVEYSVVMDAMRKILA